MKTHTYAFSFNSPFAQIAQLVEQGTENPCVTGSIPVLGTFLCLKIVKIFRLVLFYRLCYSRHGLKVSLFWIVIILFLERQCIMKENVSSALKTKMMVMTALMAVIITICSWISIPLVVPFTLQTFAIFFALVFLGGTYGTISITVYILLGIIGVPVFSGFKSGIAAITGPTGGYIVGFVFSGLLFLLLTKVFGEKKVVIIVAMVLGLLLCYLIGTLWFVHVYAGTENAKSFGTVLNICVIPFIIPDACKMALAYIMGGLVKKAVR